MKCLWKMKGFLFLELLLLPLMLLINVGQKDPSVLFGFMFKMARSS